MFDDTPTIAPAEVYQKRAEGWMLLDVRTEEEWSRGRIDGSVHIPMDQLTSRLDEVGERVVCICAVGARSGRVTAFLNQQGFEAVNLDGGLQNWVGAGKPVVT